MDKFLYHNSLILFYTRLGSIWESATPLCMDNIQRDLSVKCTITNLYHKSLSGKVPICGFVYFLILTGNLDQKL